MTIRESIEEKQPNQDTDYADTYTIKSMERQREYEHGLLYSSYSYQPTVDKNLSTAMIDRSWDDEFTEDDDTCIQLKLDHQQQQQRSCNCTDSVPSFFCGSHEQYNSGLISTTSPSSTLSYSTITDPQRYNSRTRTFTTSNFHDDLIDNTRDDSSLTNKNQPFNEQYCHNNDSGLMTTYNSEKHLDPPSTASNDSPLLVQTNAHYTSKKYSCAVCGKKFVRPSSLTTHSYSHTGEKPFQCPVERCGRRFSVISNLRRHGKIHSSFKKKKSVSK